MDAQEGYRYYILKVTALLSGILVYLLTGNPTILIINNDY